MFKLDALPTGIVTDAISNQSYITGGDSTVKIAEAHKNIICNRSMPSISQRMNTAIISLAK